jgi:hypothetical protein
MRMFAALATLGTAACLPASAFAAKPEPVVPSFIQTVVRTTAGPLASVPTRVPFGYRYVRYRWDGARRVLTIVVADRRFPVDGRHSLAFTAQRLGGSLSSCGDGREKTLQMGGNKVYWDGATAWRCVRGSGGRLVKLAAAGPNLPDVALGRLVASARRVGPVA